VHVEIWSDIACPWCYVGKRRLEAALAGYEHRDDVTVTWRSFELDPSAPPERGVSGAEHLAAKYGLGVEQARARQAQLAALAAEDGLDLRFDLARGGHTFDASARVAADVVPAEPRRFEVEASAGEPMAFVRFAVARFSLGDAPCELELYWLDAYGGGLFVPFADATSATETYGAGRYLLDTVKGADLGEDDGRLVLDFNLAYNPSCSYDPRWACPLATPANRLDVHVRAGERQPPPG